MNKSENIVPTVMTPQILFQCRYCFIKLQVPLYLSGQDGPCPHCGNTIQTPIVAAAPVEQTPPETAPRRWADPLAGNGPSATGLTRKPIFSEVPNSRSINRGVIADNSINRGDLEKKEGRIIAKILGWFFLVLLIVALATYLMNSFVAGK
jgi:hypothetical protein